jgi:tetratricopeptide (TPR) repeat protein
MIKKTWRVIFALVYAILIALLSYWFARDDRRPTSAVGEVFPYEARLTTANTAGRIADLQAKLRVDPDNWPAYSQLGLAYLQVVRETGDPAYYQKAEDVFNKALQYESQDYIATAGMGALALARHQFQEALAWGESARQINPDNPYAYGVIADAQIELGLYTEAAQTLQAMVDLRPDMSSYSRISYLRELHGDLQGAIELMQWAADSGSPVQENTAWTRVQLGNLYFNSGELDAAEAQYRLILANYPGYVYALAGLGHVYAARGDFQEASRLLVKASQVMPVPEFIITLTEIYEQTGHMNAAQQQYEVLQVIQRLYQANGVNMDLEIALFNADRRIDPQITLSAAKKAYARRPSVYAADVVAWAAYQAGQYEHAQTYSKRALRLGTRNALFLFHAGMIEYRLGNLQVAGRLLQQALQINPYFSIRFAPEARRYLEIIVSSQN